MSRNSCVDAGFGLSSGAVSGWERVHARGDVLGDGGVERSRRQMLLRDETPGAARREIGIQRLLRRGEVAGNDRSIGTSDVKAHGELGRHVEVEELQRDREAPGRLLPARDGIR